MSEHAGGFWQMLQRRVLGMEGQRNKSLEAAGFILQGAQLQQDDRRGLRRSPRGRKAWSRWISCRSDGRGAPYPAIVAINFVVANDVADAVGEDFRTAAGQVNPRPRLSTAPSVSRIESLARFARDSRPRPW